MYAMSALLVKVISNCDASVYCGAHELTAHMQFRNKSALSLHNTHLDTVALIMS